MRETGFGSPAEAAGVLDASLDYLAAADWASLGTQAHGEILGQLQRAQARLTAVSAAVLAAFTAQAGYEPDGHRSARAWLINKTGISTGAASGAVGWQRRLTRHGLIAAAMAAGNVSESWAKDIATGTDQLPEDKRDEADQILLDAAANGLPLDDLRTLARTIDETWQAQHPDPDDGNGETGDEDGFDDRGLRLGTTFGGAGKLTGDLSFADLRQWPGASVAEQEWIASRVGQPGWLTGVGADAEACDAAIAPVVTGSLDWQAADAMTDAWIEAYGLDRRRRPCGCTCGGCTCAPPSPMTPEARARLRRTLLAMAADAMSGPDGLAAYLRTRKLGVPFSGKSLPLDIGKVTGIPDHLRRAVILRDRHCAWPGGCNRSPAGQAA